MAEPCIISVAIAGSVPDFVCSLATTRRDGGIKPEIDELRELVPGATWTAAATTARARSMLGLRPAGSA